MLGMLMAQPRSAISVRIAERTTLGQILTALARRTTAQLRSCSGDESPIYTLRCYAHTE